MTHSFKLTQERKLVQLQGVDTLRPLVAQQTANAARTAAAAAGAEAAERSAEALRDQAGAARDLAQVASLTAPNVFATEAAGRVTVADGQSFWVGSGKDGAQLYRRTDASASVLLDTLPTSARLAQGDGSAMLGFVQRGAGAVVQDTREALRELRLGSITDYGAKWDGVSNSNAAFNSAFKYLSSTRVYAYDVFGVTQYKGLGSAFAPKGLYKFTSISFGGTNQVGFGIGGDGTYSTTFDFNLNADENAFNFRNYSFLHLHDLALRNVGEFAGSCAIDLNSEGGGNNLTLKRIDMTGFETCIRLNGDTVDGVAVPGDGDKSLVEQITMGGRFGFNQTRAGQCYGWVIRSCTSACTEADFMLGGLGSTRIESHIGNPLGAFIKLPEHTGGGGSARDPSRDGNGNYFGGNYPSNVVHVESTKLEYHGDGARMLIDARESVLRADQGGSTADIVLRDVAIASGADWPVPAEHVVIQVGNETAGSDGIRVRQVGGWISGIVSLGSDASGAVNGRWSFRDAVKAPDPKLLRLAGGGSHVLLEWRANENVPVDQYRGGQAFTGAIDAEKAYLWGHRGPRLVNTAAGLGADAQIGARYGGQFALTDFSPGATIKGMAVQIEKVPGTDTLVEWFAAGGPGLWTPEANTLIGSATIPAGAPVGRIVPIADLAMVDWHLLTDGAIYVRLTKPGQAQETFGRLIVFYFPRFPVVA